MFRFRKKTKDIEPNDIFLDNLAQKKEQKLGISPKKIEIKISYYKFLALFSFLFIIIIFIFFVTFYYQVIKHESFQVLANKNRYISAELTSGRGVVYDQNGEPLVSNKSIFTLYIDYEKTNSQERKILSNILNKEIKEDLTKENIDINTLINIKSYNFSSVSIEQELIREYKKPEIFSSIMGYVGRISKEELNSHPEYKLNDYIGKIGLEKSYEEFLKRKPGKVLIERDTYGNVVSEKKVSSAQPGHNLELWLDADLQNKLYQELKKVTEEVGSTRASAVALDPQTGGVLAMVSFPSYDNNIFSFQDQEAIKKLLQDKEHALLNRAINGLYSTGSTIKPLTGLAALEEEIINPEKKINCQGRITIPHAYDPEIKYVFRDLHVHGPTDMEKAIAESCNVYFYTIGGGYQDQEGLGSQRIKQYLEYFGWGEKTGIDLPGEKQGFIPSSAWKKETRKEGWWTGDTYNLSIGQGDLAVTPLQVTNSFSIIANREVMYSPKIGKNILDQQGNIIKEIKPEIILNSPFDQKNIETIRKGMRKAVTGEGVPNASATILQNLPVESAAKTGTAQTSKKNYHHNWVTVFAPYEEPEIILTILIENVEGIQLTSSLVAKETLEWYFKNYDK